MELEDVWTWYCWQRLGEPVERPQMEPLTPEAGLKLLWEFHPLFTPRMDAIRATAYSDAFDDQADAALAALARDNDLASWNELDAGTWRVLYERLAYSETVMVVNMLAGTPSIGRLPRGLDDASRSRAVLLQFLLGGGRSIDRRLLPRSTAGSAPAFPAVSSLRQQ